jgi:GTP-sensing pleiotropic transcriptional regulator CodY
MSLLKSIERLQRIDYLIRKEATGTSDEFAEKVGICRSMLMENLREMKELVHSWTFAPAEKVMCTSPTLLW